MPLKNSPHNMIHLINVMVRKERWMDERKEHKAMRDRSICEEWTRWI